MTATELKYGMPSGIHYQLTVTAFSLYYDQYVVPNSGSNSLVSSRYALTRGDWKLIQFASHVAERYSRLPACINRTSCQQMKHPRILRTVV